MRKIRLIMQKGNSDCGVACVAMLSRNTMDAAHKAIDFPNNNDFRLKIRHIRVTLTKFNISVGRKIPCQQLEKISNAEIALVAVNFKISRLEKKEWHWIVYDGTSNPSRFLDPRIGKRDSKSMAKAKIAWYHKVTF